MTDRTGHPAARSTALIARGAVAIIAGFAALHVSLRAATGFLALYLAMDGVMAFLLAWRMTGKRARALVAIEGAGDFIAAGALLWWGSNMTTLIAIVATWAIATGILEVAASVFLPRSRSFALTIGFVGLVSCLVGLVALDWTDLAEIGLLYLFGAYALIAGILFVTLGVYLTRVLRRSG